jgi:predicted N-formylglutamate amidohydrolase
MKLVLSCEHGGREVPARWRPLFRGAEALLESHRGWDPGALALARALARRLGAPLVSTTVTRLLVEPNRSLGHPRLFSDVTRPLPPAERELLLARCWRPHRARVEAALREAMSGARAVLHVGVHSFTPELDGRVREVDVGVLYDPARAREFAFCRAWIAELRRGLPGLRVRANRPYRGTSDGLTTHLRAVLGKRYLGVELEVSQALAASAADAGLVRALAGALAAAAPLAPKRTTASRG